MDHFKELELEMLIRFRDKGGNISISEFNEVFADDKGQWDAIYLMLSKVGYLTYRFQVLPNGGNTTYYQLTDEGKIRITQIQKEKIEEEKSLIESGRAKKDNTSVTNWTRVVGWGTIILILLTIYLIYLQYNPPKASEPYSKGMDSLQRAKFQQRLDSLAKTGSDTIYQDSGDEVHDPLPPEIKSNSDSLK
jgi:hypothetical protein